MEFTKIISSPVFAASAPDIGLEAQSASPVKIVVTTPSASWDITLSPVSDADGKNLLNIRLRDILSAVASAPAPSETEPNSAIPLLMVNLSASNTEGEQASMDIPVAFGTLNGKDPKDFTGQWLTSREQICLTYSWARERLSLIFGPQLLRWSGSVSLTVNCRAYYASGKARNFQLVSAGSSDAVYYSVDCSYSAISALDDSGEQLVAWDLSYTLSGINADGESDSVDSFPQRFILANQDGHIREYIFANCFGMEDRVFGEGVARREVSGSSSTFVNGGKTLEVSNDAEIVYEAFSGQLADRRAVFHWYDFLSSSSRLIFSAADGSMTHIVVEGHDSETDDFSVGGVSFSYRLSEKNGVYPDGLCGTIGDYDPNQQCGALWVGDDPQAVTPAEEDLFFLKHRLSEFQTLTVSDALLLLVQSPATDAWGSVSLGSIKSWIKKFLDGESREIRLNSLADYETADGKVIDPAKLQNGSIPVWDAAAGAYHPVPASELGDYGINPKLYPLVFQKGKDVVLTYAPNVGKAVLDISDFASAETLSTHISDKDIHVTAEQKSAWDLVASLFGVNEEGNIYIKGDRGLISYSFVSARGSDPEAGSGGSGGGLDVQAMWYALGQPTGEKINASHIPALPISQITGLQSALNSKLESITKPMVEEVLTGTITSHNHDGRYAPLSGGLIPSQYLPSYVDDVLECASKTAFPATGEAGKIYVALDTNLTYRWGGSAYVEISPSLALGHTSSTAYPGDEGAALAALVEGMKEITDLFGIDEDGNVYVKDGKGFYGTSFVSARGSDPLAGSSGAGGLDIDAMWEALAAAGTQKINASHIPLLQQLSGQITNAQLANSSLSVAGVSVPLGGAVSAEQIASALGLGSNAYTSTAYLPLAGGTMSGNLTARDLIVPGGYYLYGVKESGGSMVGFVNGRTQLGSIGTSTSAETLIRSITGHVKCGINGAQYDMLDSGNYTNYTVTKTGGGASGAWGISISGIANRAVYLTSTYTGSGGLQPPSYFNGMGLKVNMMNHPASYCDVIVVNGYGGSGSDVPYINALAFKKSSAAHGDVWHARGDYGGSSWGTWYKFLDEYNYADYTVTKTGGGASGTWPISVSGSSNTLISTTDTAISNYVRYRQIVGQTSLVGSNAVNGAWCLPTTGGDAKYGNGQILRFGWAPSYYTDLHTGPNEIGSASGLQFRQVIAGAVSKLGWRTLLDTANYAGILDSLYVKKSGDTMTGALKVSANAEPLAEFIRTNTSESYIAIGNSSGRRAALSYHPTYKASIYNYVGNDYMGLLDDGTPHVNGNKIWYSGNDGSGSGLDADTLDGYHAASLSRLLSYINSGTKTAAGWYRVFTASSDRTDALGENIILHLARSYNHTNNEAYTFCISVAYYNQVNITQVSGHANVRLITKIRVVSVPSGALYVDFYLSTTTNGNTYYITGSGPGTFQEATAVSTPGGNVTEFTTVNGCKSSGGFSGNLSGNASSATKLATARSLWGQSFDGTQNVNGYIYLDSQSHRIFFGTSGTTVYLCAGDGYFTINRATNTSYAANLLRINLSSGAVGINAVPSAMLHVGGTGYFSSNLEVSGTIRASTGIWSNGYVSAKGQDTTSDARYKRDVAALPAQAALAVLMRLRPSTWAWKDDGRRGAGFVAQEVLGVLPEAVREVGDGEDRHLALNYQMLHAYEVCLLQTHETELERLRGRVNQLENEIKRIRYGS